MEPKKNSILVIGSLNYDIILQQQRLPARGETFTADSVTTGGGGKGANQAVQAAKMNVPTVMFGAVGHDLYGEHLRKELTTFGLDTTLIKRTEISTGLGVNNVLPDGTLYASIVRGANYALTTDDIDQIESEIACSKIVIFQLEIPRDVTEYAIAVARRHNCYIILNAAPAMELSASTLATVDCLIVNEHEASFYAKKPINSVKEAITSCEPLHGMVRDLVVITLGENGSLLYNGEEKTLIPAHKVKAVDTTGAGDSYTGVFAAKLLSDVSYKQGAIYATLAASLTVTKPGAQGAMPTADRVEELYRRISLDPVKVK